MIFDEALESFQNHFQISLFLAHVQTWSLEFLGEKFAQVTHHVFIDNFVAELVALEAHQAIGTQFYLSILVRSGQASRLDRIFI